jgi:hypothetical protein
MGIDIEPIVAAYAFARDNQIAHELEPKWIPKYFVFMQIKNEPRTIQRCANSSWFEIDYSELSNWLNFKSFFI